MSFRNKISLNGCEERTGDNTLKMSKNRSEKICKNSPNGGHKKYIRIYAAKMLSIEAFWGRFLTEICARESRHHVAKFRNREGFGK